MYKAFIFILLIPLQALLGNDMEGWPSLHAAIASGDTQKAFEILAINPEQAHQKTPSIKLAYSHIGNNADEDYDVHFADEEGISAIELAVKMNNEEITELLIQLGANPVLFRIECISSIYTNFETRKGYIYLKHKNSEPLYLREGKQQKLLTPLYWAILNNNASLVQRILTFSPDTSLVYRRHEYKINDTRTQRHEEFEQYSALELATTLGYNDIIDLLKPL